MLISLAHVTLRSADFDRTERFYCDVLRLRPGPRPAIPVPGRWFYIGKKAVLHVLPRAAEAAKGARSAIDHFALDAADLRAFEERLRATGWPFESKRLANTGVWQVFLTDPDGARVELCFSGGDVP